MRPGRPGRRLGALRPALAALLLAVAACTLVVVPPDAASAADNGDARPARAADFRLARAERKAAAILDAQRRGFLRCHATGLDHLLTSPFTQVRRRVRSSALYRTLKRMPKGGMLHLHSTATGRASWIVDRALSEKGCFVYWGPPSADCVKGQLAFFPGSAAPTGWMPAATLAHLVPDLRARLSSLYTLGPEDAHVPDIWGEFEAIFQRIDGFVSYRPVFLDYYTDAFRLLARDGIQFVELRTSLDTIQGEDGRDIDDEEVLDLYRVVLARVRADYPGFDLRIIVCTWRGASLDEAAAQMERTRAFMRSDPDLIAGFDVIAQEDGEHSNAFYAPVLASEPRVPLYLHGGESLSPANTNVRDAWELGATRIGHAINLMYFPALERQLRSDGVTLEVCPISNQALRYVPDPRRHPARGFLRRAMRIALGSDDPAILGTTGLTDDLWMTCVAWNLGLHTLKRLAVTSILRSSLPALRMEQQMDRFEARWQRFIRSVIRQDAAAERSKLAA